MSAPKEDHPLPNFGSARTALSIVALALIVALLLTVARHRTADWAALQDLLVTGGFALLLAVVGVIALQLVKGPVRRMPPRKALTTVFVTLLAATAAATEGIVAALYYAGITPELWPDWHLWLLARTLIVAALVSAVAMLYLVLHHRSRIESKLSQAAKLQALQSRIRPHFLFNSMNSIASLVRSDPEKAEKALQDLADVFRVLLADARKLVPITAETQLARQYLAIEKLRLGDRLQVKWLTSNVPRSAQIPSLALQPLLENAIYHGIEPCFTGGLIKVEMWGENGMLNIMITNPVPEVPSKAHHKGNKIAMQNIRQRLKQHFQDAATMQAFERFGNYHVKIRMPLIRA